MAADDDAALIVRIARQDSAALRLLFARHQTRVFRFLARLVRNEAVAEELTNEVFMEVWRHAGRFEGRSAVGTWILSIAHNRAASSLRKRREEGWSDEHAMRLVDTGDDPEISAQKGDKAAILRSCLDGLSAEHREIVDLIYYQEKSVGEVAEIVGIPEATVKTRMFYARKKLSELLKAAGVDRGWP